MYVVRASGSIYPIGGSKNAPRVLYSHPELCNDSVKLDPRLLKWTQPHTFVPPGASAEVVGHRLHFFPPSPSPSVPSDPKQIYDNVIVGTIVSIMAIHPARCSGTMQLAFASGRSVGKGISWKTIFNSSVVIIVFSSNPCSNNK